MRIGLYTLMGAIISALGFTSCNKTKVKVNAEDNQSISIDEGARLGGEEHIRLMYGLAPSSYEPMDTPQRDGEPKEK